MKTNKVSLDAQQSKRAPCSLDEVKKLISFALPIYNEQENLPLFYQALTQAIEPLVSLYEFEIIFVNDGSRDNSWNIIKELAMQDSRVHGINFSRNFGQQMALIAAYDHAKGSAIISLDTDLQDPPSLIPAMLEAWERGARVVYARRVERSDRWLKRWTAALFYRFMARIAEINIPQQVAYFCLVDRIVLRTINQSREQSPFLRGLIGWTGFPWVYVDFKRPERSHGQTNYTWKKLFLLAFDAIIGFSSSQIRLPLYFCILFSVIAPAVWLWNLHTVTTPLLMNIIYAGLSLQFLVLWILGEYMVRIYDQLRGRPLYIIAQEINGIEQQSYKIPLQAKTKLDELK